MRNKRRKRTLFAASLTGASVGTIFTVSGLGIFYMLAFIFASGISLSKLVNYLKN